MKSNAAAVFSNTNAVKFGDKERFDEEQIGVNELCTDYQPFYTINIKYTVR